jgi:AraC-like DNA-binding protein
MTQRANPVAELASRFAARRGCAVQPGGGLDATWASLAQAGQVAPGLVFASWLSAAAVGGVLLPAMANSPDLSGAERQVALRGMPWTARLAEAIPPGHPPSITEAARKLLVSPRVLQEHLKAEGTTYSALIDAWRRERALALLAASGMSVSEIATRAGFSSPAALTRAVRRWTGESPAGYRQAHRA